MKVEATDSGNFDYIIVGGGSAGCVVANRLSADPKIRVLLIEAGQDFKWGSEPAGLRDRGARSFMLSQYFWPDLQEGERQNPILQAKVMGGGSSINGMHAQRGLPRDYDEWRQYGIEGWGWDDVLPFFKRLESDADFDNAVHGKDGPISIRRIPESQWSELTLALREALDKRGVPRVQDLNAEGGDATAATPLSNSPDARMSTAVAYLTPEVRGRGNLRIIADSKALRVTFQNRRVTGVELEGGRRMQAPNVVICAGAINSPALLLRSGIGPAEDLRDAGITVVADRPGVGRNLLNHPILTVSSHIKRAARRQNFRAVRQPVPMLVRYSSKVPGTPPTDMVLNLWERVPGPLENDPLGRQLAQLMVILNKSYSQGKVTLNPADPMGPQRVKGNILSDIRDLQRMVAGFRMVGEMLTEAPMARFINNVFVSNMAIGLPPDAVTLKMFQDNRQAQLISTAAAFAMDYVPGMRDKSMRKAGRDIASILAEPDKLADFILSATAMGGHPAGTCRLGGAGQLEAVVDSRCRVFGVEGLRVIDASIFPTLMTAGTNIPTIMAAEKASDMAIQDRRVSLQTAAT